MKIKVCQNPSTRILATEGAPFPPGASFPVTATVNAVCCWEEADEDGQWLRVLLANPKVSLKTVYFYPCSFNTISGF